MVFILSFSLFLFIKDTKYKESTIDYNNKLSDQRIEITDDIEDLTYNLYFSNELEDVKISLLELKNSHTNLINTISKSNNYELSMINNEYQKIVRLLILVVEEDLKNALSVYDIKEDTLRSVESYSDNLNLLNYQTGQTLNQIVGFNTIN